MNVVYSNMEVVLGEGKKCLLGTCPLSVELLMHLNTVPNGGVLCRKEFFELYGLFDPHLILRRINDWDMWLRGFRLGAKFSHCDLTSGREFGPASPASLGNSVDWDYKATHAYMVCERQLESRSAALRPEVIGAYDVFDPERVLPYLRDFQEWEHTEKVVYEPFFSSHPHFTYTRPSRHNRRFDAELAGYSLNGVYDVSRSGGGCCWSRTVTIDWWRNGSWRWPRSWARSSSPAPNGRSPAMPRATSTWLYSSTARCRTCWSG